MRPTSGVQRPPSPSSFHPDVVRTLGFFDAATCATRVDMPVVVASAGHAEYPAQADEQVRFHALAASLLNPDG